MKWMKFMLLGMAVVMLAGNAHASIFATEVVDHSASLSGSSLYNDPNNLLGKPTTLIPGIGGTSHVSIVEPAWSKGTLTTFNNGDWAVVKFDHQVTNDPNNPYGLDFIVYGNAFFPGSGSVYNTTNHQAYTIGGGLFAEPLKISVSQNGVDWYTYDNGPFGDSYYPTNPWVWDPALYAATRCGWTTQENDYSKPVDPSLTATDFAGSSYAAMLLYDGSAGGAGFDLAETGWDWIQYIKVAGVSGFSGGEIDAFADVAAVSVPEPGTLLLLGTGLVLLAGVRRKAQPLCFG